MPKIKNNRAAQKRFRVTASGKIKRAQGFKNHILTKKRSKRKNDLTKGTYVHESNQKNIERLIGLR